MISPSLQVLQDLGLKLKYGNTPRIIFVKGSAQQIRHCLNLPEVYYANFEKVMDNTSVIADESIECIVNIYREFTGIYSNPCVYS